MTRPPFQRNKYTLTLTLVDNILRQNVLWPTQFWWLLWRSFVDSYRNPSVHALRILQKIVSIVVRAVRNLTTHYLHLTETYQAIAILAGLCFHGLLDSNDQRGIQNIQGALFILTTENTFPALYGTLSIFPNGSALVLIESAIIYSNTYCCYQNGRFSCGNHAVDCTLLRLITYQKSSLWYYSNISMENMFF